MTKTIEEITRKFYEVIYNYSDDEHKDYWHLVTRKIDGEDDPSWELKPEYKEEMQKELEKTVCSFADNSDDFAAAFAAFITCVIRYNLCDDDESYEDVLSEAANRLVPSGLEDSEDLKQFLKDFSKTICENDYDNIEVFCDYYSIALLYAFCYYMVLYCFRNGESPEADENEMEFLKKLYQDMPDDMRKYALSLENYDEKIFNPAAPDQLFPFCYFRSEDELDMDAISTWWQRFSENPDNDDIRQACIYCIIKKLNSRLNKDESGDDEDIDTLKITDPIADKNEMLHIPAIIPETKSFVYKLLDARLDIDNQKDQLVKLQKEKETIIDRFSHRYRQMGATALYTTAQALFEMDSEACKEHGRVVLEEYNIKENLTTSIGILELSFTGKNDEIKENIQNSVSKIQQTNCSILVLVNNLIKKSLLQLFYGVTNKDEKIRQTCFKGNIGDLIDLFNKEVLFKDKSNAIEWFNNNIAKLDITISNLWKQIFFEEHGYADVAISDLLVDIVQNAVKYADKEEPIFLEFADENDYMIIKSKNKVRENKTKLGRKKGLKSQNAFLNTLNRTIKEIDNSIEYNENNGEFFIKAKINKLLLGG